MKEVVKVRTSWDPEVRFDAEYVNPEEKAKAEGEALFQAIEYLNGELLKRLPSPPDVSRREGE